MTRPIEASKSTYVPIRSAFTVIEKPLRFCYDRYDPDPEDLKKQKSRYYLGGMVVYPLVICAAPVTMLADMAIGVAECIFRTLSGDSLRDVAELARKKTIVSNLHNLTFIITSLALPALLFTMMFNKIHKTDSSTWVGLAKHLIPFMGIAAYSISKPLVPSKKNTTSEEIIKTLHKAPASLKPFTNNRLMFMAAQTFFVALASWNFISLGNSMLPALTIFKVAQVTIPFTLFISVCWTWNYTLSQRMIGSFSSSWNHQAFSIFVNRGAQIKPVGYKFDNERDPHRTFQDLAFKDGKRVYSDYMLKICKQPCPLQN
jgi:hypothetical protein